MFEYFLKGKKNIFKYELHITHVISNIKKIIIIEPYYLSPNKTANNNFYVKDKF